MWGAKTKQTPPIEPSVIVLEIGTLGQLSLEKTVVPKKKKKKKRKMLLT